MSSQVTEKAISDVLPSMSHQIPDVLKQLTQNLYLASKNKINLRPAEEIARPHLSAYIAVERLHTKMNLPAPSLKNFPVPAKSASALLSIFKLNLLSDVKTPSTTPSATPRKRPNTNPVPVTPSPQKRKRGRPFGSKTKTDFQKRLEEAAANEADFGSSPNKQLTEELKAEEGTTEQSLSDLKLLSSREITSLCNKFQLDGEIVENILRTFQKHSTRISNEWSLIVGLILNCYFVVNHKVLKENIIFKNSVLKAMATAQNGGLMFSEIKSSMELVHNLIVYNKWFKLLKAKYDYPVYETQELGRFGSMITKDYQFSSKLKIDDYEEWAENINKLIKS